MRIKSIAALVCILVLVGSVQAENPVHYRVKLNVSASDSLKGEITSYLSRRIREISDLEIVDDNPGTVISVIAIESSDRGGVTRGYALSVVVDCPVDYEQTRERLTAKLDQMTLALMDLSFKHTTRIVSHFILTGGTDDLEKLCRKIVANVDGDVIEGERKTAREVADLLKKN